MAMQQRGASKKAIIYVLHYLKESIRARDAELAAWLFGPGRHLWVSARMDQGEFADYAEIGRALEGDELQAA